MAKKLTTIAELRPEVRREIKEKIRQGGIPVRIAVYDGENFLAYKADSCWSLSEKHFKIHSPGDSRADRHLAKNLLYCFNEDTQDPFNKETFQKSWFRRFPQGVRVVVEDLRESQFGKKLFEYRIVKAGEMYVVQS